MSAKAGDKALADISAKKGINMMHPVPPPPTHHVYNVYALQNQYDWVQR